MLLHVIGKFPEAVAQMLFCKKGVLANSQEIKGLGLQLY